MADIRSRRRELALLLRKEGYLSVQQLSERFNISTATIRRDLAELARRNEITRTHGGALSEYDVLFAPFFQRQARNPEQKDRVAARALREIQPGEVVFLDAGSTVYSLARQIASQAGLRLTIVTNSLPTAEVLSSNSGVEVHLLGGQLLAHQLVLVGRGASLSLSAWRFDRAFLGAQGLDAEGLWNSEEEISDFQRHICGRAARHYFCLDDSKVGLTAPSFLMSWKEMDRLITTAGAEALSSQGIQLDPRRILNAAGAPGAG